MGSGQVHKLARTPCGARSDGPSCRTHTDSESPRRGATTVILPPLQSQGAPRLYESKTGCVPFFVSRAAGRHSDECRSPANRWAQGQARSDTASIAWRRRGPDSWGRATTTRAVMRTQLVSWSRNELRPLFGARRGLGRARALPRTHAPPAAAGGGDMEMRTQLIYGSGEISCVLILARRGSGRGHARPRARAKSAAAGGTSSRTILAPKGRFPIHFGTLRGPGRAARGTAAAGRPRRMKNEQAWMGAGIGRQLSSVVEQRFRKAQVRGSNPRAGLATIAQLAEQRICNAQVGGSSPPGGSDAGCRAGNRATRPAPTWARHLAAVGSRRARPVRQGSSATAGYRSSNQGAFAAPRAPSPDPLVV